MNFIENVLYTRIFKSLTHQHVPHPVRVVTDILHRATTKE